MQDMIANLQEQATEQKELPITVIANDSGILDFDKDRYLLECLDVERYVKNPVICLNHKRDELPIGKCVDMRLEGGQFICKIELYKGEVDSEHSQLCATVKDMIDKGFIKGLSITTRDIEVYPNEYGGFDIVRSELIEISIVTIPNNENSLVIK